MATGVVTHFGSTRRASEAGRAEKTATGRGEDPPPTLGSLGRMQVREAACQDLPCAGGAAPAPTQQPRTEVWGQGGQGQRCPSKWPYRAGRNPRVRLNPLPAPAPPSHFSPWERGITPPVLTPRRTVPSQGCLWGRSSAPGHPRGDGPEFAGGCPKSGGRFQSREEPSRARFPTRHPPSARPGRIRPAMGRRMG